MNGYINAWKTKLTGATGKATEYMDYYRAKNLVFLYNKEYPENDQFMAN